VWSPQMNHPEQPWQKVRAMRYKFKSVPYGHQMEALEISWKKPYYALFMDMGTGKSKVLIDTSALLYDNGHIQALLIVAPKSVYRNWLRNEIPKHMPEHVVHRVVAWSPKNTQKKQKELNTLFEPPEELKILLMNVEAFSTKKGVAFARLFLLRWQTLLAIDESTTIKTRTASRTKNLIKLGKMAKYRRILTGSPITKSPLDLFTQCEFLEEGSLEQSSFWAFQNRYAKMVRRNLGNHSFNQVVGYQNLQDLNSIIAPFSFRVRKEECLDLPAKVYTRRTVELTAPQQEAYATLKRAALAIIEGTLISAPHVLTQILRLQQVCSGYARMDNGTVKYMPTNKLKELLSVVEETAGKIIIWANFTHDIRSIEKELIKLYGEKSCATFYGDTPLDKRQDIVEMFQTPDHPLRFFIGQPRTGGYGLTLTEAKTVIYYSNGYDLEVRLQSEDRAHRIGQHNKVTYIDIIAEGTVDEKILKALRGKIDIASQVLAEGYREWLI
jgi:SNF2 family DNA or RNA helicase